MGKPHKWAKEIIAWANGAKIERRYSDYNSSYSSWEVVPRPDWLTEKSEYRIKPQPKEQQYLYVYEHMGCIDITTDKNFATKDMEYIGKIKLETDDD